MILFLVIGIIITIFLFYLMVIQIAKSKFKSRKNKINSSNKLVFLKDEISSPSSTAS